MPTQHSVVVTCNSADNSLSVDHETVILSFPDDWVEWTIDPASVPSNSALMIVFEQALGPFEVVRGVDGHTLVAKGNKGDASTVFYSYNLYLNIPGTQPQDTGNLAMGGPFTIENQCPDVFRSPWLTVTFTPSTSPNELGTVDAQPPTLLFHEGDTALVEFVGIPDDHVVAFFFPVDDSTTGPFPGYFVTLKDGTGPQRIGGATFNSTVAGIVSYGVRIWNADGVLVGRQDPSIDGLGRPPDT